ncbi:acyl-coenzyme A thioesterase 11-like [Aplochiton taeniatus]
MFTETAHHLKSVAPLLVQTAILNESRIISAHGGFRVHGRRHFNVSGRLCAKIAPPKKPRVQVDIPGLERVTYMDRMHYVPGLAKPAYPTWTRNYKDPGHYYSPPAEQMPLHKQKPCFIFHQRTNVLEGVRQALWLTKSKLTQGLPDQVTALGDNPANQIADQDDRVQNAIRHARFWDTTEPRPGREQFCPTLLRNLLHLCGSLQATHPALSRRILAEKYSISATWRRGEDLFQVRGQNGLLLNSASPLPVLAGKEEVEQTADHVLETFYPISPTIDLQSTQLYQEESYTGTVRMSCDQSTLRTRREEEGRNPTEVKMSQIIMPCHSNHRQELSVGQLLKWMDSTACLSAERHAGCPCVTASMDDIHFQHTIGVGQVVNIRSKVNRAFNTSMEVGIVVSCEDLFTDRHWKVCQAYATFVTQRTQAGKVVLRPLVPVSQSEVLEHSLAAERRRMRLLHHDIIKDLLTNRAFQQGGGPELDQAMPAERTRVESVELVLPPHANHQVNTFGGQIMAWMENVATIAASRLCRAHPTLRSIDMFTFRGPSQVGDRLLLHAIVNNSFKNSMEVGVCAEAYQGEEPLRHINSAFMTFEVLDKEGKPRTLPRIRPEPLDGTRRYQEAVARRKIRLDRKYIISCKQTEVPLSVPWDPSNQVYLSYNNVSALKMLAARNDWSLTSEKDQVLLYTLEQKEGLSFRVQSELDVPAETAFRLLADLSNRQDWDPHYQKCEFIHRVDDDDFLYRVVTPSIRQGSANQGAEMVQDFILLASSRTPCGSGEPYVVALRSVTLPTHPPTDGFNRGEVMCAGFTILQTTPCMSQISYYAQASPEMVPYISTDIAGLSSSFYGIFCSFSQYLTRRRKEVLLPADPNPATGSL